MRVKTSVPTVTITGPDLDVMLKGGGDQEVLLKPTCNAVNIVTTISLITKCKKKRP